MDQPHEYRRVAEAVDYISARLPAMPRIGLILGTGLGRIMEGLPIEAEISMAWVPGMIPPGVTSHSGKIYAVTWHDQAVIILAGRVHYYEGHDMADVVRPVRILKGLGCTHLVTTNAAGGIHPSFDAGDAVLVRDHINLMQAHPLRGPNEARWGPRFPDMSEAYDPAWLDRTRDLAKTDGLSLKSGVYAGLTGPSLETPAEYRFLHTIGADLVGMSAVPEVIVARHMDMRVLGLSVVSNVCYPPERIVKTTVEDVIRTVEAGAETARLAVAAAIRGSRAERMA
jgi:purine-nucleoside phosphorylase